LATDYVTDAGVEVCADPAMGESTIYRAVKENLMKEACLRSSPLYLQRRLSPFRERLQVFSKLKIHPLGRVAGGAQGQGRGGGRGPAFEALANG